MDIVEKLEEIYHKLELQDAVYIIDAINLIESMSNQLSINTWISVRDNDESIHADNLVKFNKYLIKLNSVHEIYEAVYWNGYEFQHEETAIEYQLDEVSHYMLIIKPAPTHKER